MKKGFSSGWAYRGALTALLGALFAPMSPRSDGRAAFVPHLPLVARSAKLEQRRYGLGDWRLNISRDQFSGDIACRMQSRDRNIVYVANALGFRFAKHLNTLDAWVKIDDAKAYRWRDDLPELARLGVAIDGRNLNAPTDGIVWIPVASLAEANRVAIQARPGRRPRIFSMRGFSSLRDSARTMGCAPEARFIR